MKDILIKIYNILLNVIICYVSGWLLILKPLINLFLCNNITGAIVMGVFLKVILAVIIAILIYVVGVKIALKLFT